MVWPSKSGCSGCSAEGGILFLLQKLSHTCTYSKCGLSQKKYQVGVDITDINLVDIGIDIDIGIDMIDIGIDTIDISVDIGSVSRSVSASMSVSVWVSLSASLSLSFAFFMLLVTCRRRLLLFLTPSAPPPPTLPPEMSFAFACDCALLRVRHPLERRKRQQHENRNAVPSRSGGV